MVSVFSETSDLWDSSLFPTDLKHLPLTKSCPSSTFITNRYNSVNHVNMHQNHEWTFLTVCYPCYKELRLFGKQKGVLLSIIMLFFVKWPVSVFLSSLSFNLTSTLSVFLCWYRIVDPNNSFNFFPPKPKRQEINSSSSAKLWHPFMIVFVNKKK